MNNNDVCKNCGLCCNNIPFKEGFVIRDGFHKQEDFFEALQNHQLQNCNEKYREFVQNLLQNVEFLTCKYFKNGIGCTNPNPPEYCINYPNTAISIVDEDCYFAGENFLKLEQLKQRIRKYKEEILIYQTLIDNNDKDKSSYQRIINNHKKQIDKYKLLGSEDW